LLVLPSGYAVEVEDGPRLKRVLNPAQATVDGRPVLRVGVLNVMPKAESYEPYLLRPLAHSELLVEPVWIRLESHSYTSSDAAHIERHYRTFGEALGQGPLSGLILTGAPVEELDFESVHYWRELAQILEFARQRLKGTLGLCWGGLALAKLVGLDKESFPRKLFGVFQNRSLSAQHPITGSFDDTFFCAHSRHSGISDRTLEDARDREIVNLLSHGPETGYTIFESSDRRYLMHLGHPEYEANRLVHEWQRDRALCRTDVERPSNFDPDRPSNTWRSHRNELFSQWLRFLTE
jgi:homoserine O-succinyltransferase/O-acetyltransferase